MTLCVADRDVLVAGAGLPGLAAACALAHLGLPSRFVDRAGVGLSAAPSDVEDWDPRAMR
jgi:2-polyprenyl-6-methoxyphenol hydroxylase-like FAD-dependent oxidoreductase